MGDKDVARRPGMPVAALHGVRPPVRQVIRKVGIVRRLIRTCERSMQSAEVMPAERLGLALSVRVEGSLTYGD
jgi:hypothetical protein